MKLVLALWQPDLDAVLGAGLRASLAEIGASRLQVNLDDEHIAETALRLQAFEEPLGCVVSVWTDRGARDVLEVVGPVAHRVAAWEVDERIPLAPPEVADGRRDEALAQVAFLRRPADLPYDAWLAHWHGPHTQVAMETQASFGYVQNRVVRALTEDSPHVDAVVEELFPPEAMHDLHAFYGSGASDAELGRRITRLMESVTVMGADHDLDVVPTSRYVFDLG